MSFSQILSLLVSINFGICLVLTPSHAYSTFRLASIYFGEIILCTKFTKINGKPIFRALQYCVYYAVMLPMYSLMVLLEKSSAMLAPYQPQTRYNHTCMYTMHITKFGSTLYIGMDEVLAHYACTFENSKLHFHFQL